VSSISMCDFSQILFARLYCVLPVSKLQYILPSTHLAHMHHTTRIHVMHKWCLTFVPYMLNDITLFGKGRLGYSLKQTDY